MVPTVLLPQRPSRVQTPEKERYLSSLAAEAHAHPAIHHVWLRKIANSNYPDMHWVLADFAREYYGYSASFPNYLRLVIDKLEDENHKELLTRNLEEEQGSMDEDDRKALIDLRIDPQTVDGIPHPELYRRFCYAIGITDTELSTPSHAARCWRDRFMRFLANATPAAAVGALGLGTENIVKPVYRQLLDGIRRLGTLDRKDYVFFELHCTVDDQHALDLHNVALELLKTRRSHREMRLGMCEALDMRQQFWSHLARRANSVLRAASA